MANSVIARRIAPKQSPKRRAVVRRLLRRCSQCVRHAHGLGPAPRNDARFRRLQSGYLLLPVAVAIALIGVIAFLISSESAIETNMAAGELQAARAEYVDPDGADRIVLDGTALDDGDKVSSGGNPGEFICMLNDSTAGWTTLGRAGIWSDGGA